MNTYELYNRLEQVGLFDLGKDQYKKFHPPGEFFMPLSVEIVHHESADGLPILSMMHFGVQNGDLMREPEVCIEFNPVEKWATPISFRNDYGGKDESVYVYKHGKLIGRNEKLEFDLKEFVGTWLTNLVEQGYKLKQPS